MPAAIYAAGINGCRVPDKTDKQATARLLYDSFIAQSNVCFAKILAALSYFSQYMSSISTHTDAMKNNHISQFYAVFTRSRTPAGVVGR